MKNTVKTKVIVLIWALLIMIILSACTVSPEAEKSQTASVASTIYATAPAETATATESPAPTATPTIKATATVKATIKPTATAKATATAVISSKSITVYITNTGKKYHTASCRYLSKSNHAITLYSAKAQGYTTCSVCHPPQ